MSDRDIVLRGGRVIDPESGLDAVRNVAISGGQVTEIAGGAGGPVTEIAGGRVAEIGGGPGTEIGGCRVAEIGGGPRPGLSVIDVTGLAVTAGFIDLHSHAGSVAGLRLQALDGVTTALELEAGATPVAAAYAAAAAEGRPVNYGFATSWAQARMEAVAGISPDGKLGTFMTNIADPAWQRPATQAEITAMLDRLSADLADGALGIGVLLGYAPATGADEYLRVAALAASAGVPVFTHARDLIEVAPRGVIDGAEEIVRAAGETGAAMHYCHVNSTSGRHIDRVLSVVGRAQAAGARVTTEAYPYGSGMTGIGAAFLAPERLGERGLTPSSLTYVPTGERIASEARLRELRRTDPGGHVIIKHLDEQDTADRRLLMRSLEFPGAVVASDAMPLTWARAGRGRAPEPTAGSTSVYTWPPPANAITHPRSAGTFSRAIRMLSRDGGPLSLADALTRCSLLPARLLQDRVPAIRRKGRVQPGSDADLVVFDPATISDRSSYADSTRPSAGIVHVLVNGRFVVQNGKVVDNAQPGQPIRSAPR